MRPVTPSKVSDLRQWAVAKGRSLLKIYVKRLHLVYILVFFLVAICDDALGTVSRNWF